MNPIERVLNGKQIKLKLIQLIIGTHHIDSESHLDPCHRHQAVRPSIVDYVSLNYYQQAVLKCHFLSPATSIAADSPLIWLKCRRFLHFSFFPRCFFSIPYFVMRFRDGNVKRIECRLLVKKYWFYYDLLLTRRLIQNIDKVKVKFFSNYCWKHSKNCRKLLLIKFCLSRKILI